MSQPKDDPDTPAHDAETDDAGSTDARTSVEPDTRSATGGDVDQATDEGQPERKPTRLERRRQKIREEIERNRRGDFVVPTWVLATALAAIVIGWALLIILA